MKLCGWDMRAMSDRYTIIDERHLRAGVHSYLTPSAAMTETGIEPAACG